MTAATDVGVLSQVLRELNIDHGWRVGAAVVECTDAVGADALGAAIADFPLRSGWICTTDAVLWTGNGGAWHYLDGSWHDGVPTRGVLSAELAGDDCSLAIHHCGGGSWQLVRTRKSAGETALVRSVRHLSVIEGWVLEYDLFFEVRSGRYQPVAQQFRGLVMNGETQ
ncbi:MAG TPA: hypothetical protein VK196_16010 [Magnetospirillum sp.]|nr:hypothetical protein [Magnetospirillum sp.]